MQDIIKIVKTGFSKFFVGDFKLISAQEKVLKVCNFLVDSSIFLILLLVPVYFSFISETWNIFELPKVIIFRYLLSIGILAWLLKFFLKGSFKYKLPRVVFYLLSLMVLSWLVSVIFSIHPQLSFWGKYQRQQGFVSLFSYVLFFLLTVSALKDWKKIKLFIASILLSSFFVCAYGVVQIFCLDPMNWAEPFGLYQRAFSSLGQPNFFAHFLVIVLPLTIYCSFFLTRKFLARFIFLLLATSQLFCLYWTKSRSGWLAVMGELWLGAFFWLIFSKRKKLLFGFLGVSVFFVATVLTISSLPKGHMSFWETNRLASSLDLSSGSTQMRINYWSGAVNEFVHASWLKKSFGYGQDVLSDVTVKWYRPDWGISEKLNMWPDRVHNFVLDTLMSTGAFGLLLSCFILFYVVRKIISFFKTGERGPEYWLLIFLCLSLFGYFVNNLFSFSMTPQYVYFYFLMAMVATIIFSSRAEKIVSIRFSVISRALIFLSVTVFLAIFVFYRGAMALEADYYFSAARDQEAISNCQALEFNRAATILNPEEAVYREEYVFNGLSCFEGLKELSDKKTLQENIRITLSSLSEKEKGYYVHLEEANAASLFSYYTDKSLKNETDRRFLKMMDDYPSISQPYLYYAYHKMRQGDFKDVPALIASGTALLPELTLPIDEWNRIHLQDVANEWIRFYDLAGISAELSGNYELAIENYIKLLKADPYKLLTYKKIADIYYQKNDLEKALWYNKRGYSLNKNDYSWPLAIALVLMEKKDWLSAKDYLSQALTLDKENENVKKFLKEVEEKLIIKPKSKARSK